MEPLKIASVGLGWWGGVLAEKSVAAGLELVTCFARTVQNRDQFAEVHGCRSAESWDAVLADPEVEAVVLATPHSTHADQVVEAAAAGKHVFCDKPFTLNVAEGKRAVKAAEEAGVVLQVGHNRRRQPANRRLKAMVENGELGMIHYAEANLSYPKGLDPRGGWRYDRARCAYGGHAGLSAWSCVKGVRVQPQGDWRRQPG